MKNIFKYLIAAVVAIFFVTSCNNDDDYRDWTTPEPSFKLYDSNLGVNVLYPTMENNPFILTWDNTAGTGNYSVVMSTSADFSDKIELGTSTTNTFSTTVGDLNTALLQAGISPYQSQTVYFRIEQGSNVSNTISFNITPYPAEGPVITNPKGGNTFVLDQTNASGVVTTVTWDDYATYPVDVTYTVEIRKVGSTAWTPAGSVVNARSIDWVTSDFNEALASAGLVPNVAQEVEVRVTSSTVSAGGTLVKASEPVTITVTPYIAQYLDFYLVGGGTAVGWNAGGAQKLLQTNNISEIYMYLEQNGDFRFLGQQDWNPLNYSLNTDGIRPEYKYFNTWPETVVRSGDENMKFTGASGIYKITIDQNTRALNIEPSAIPTVPAQVYLVGSINGWDAAAAIPMDKISDGLFEYVTQLPDNAEFKFIGQQSWGDLEWANIHTAGNSGYLGPKGDNNNIQFSGGGNFYKITVDIKRGIFKIEM